MEKKEHQCLETYHCLTVHGSVLPLYTVFQFSCRIVSKICNTSYKVFCFFFKLSLNGTHAVKIPATGFLPLHWCNYLQGIIYEVHLQAFSNPWVSLLAKKIWFVLRCVQGLFTWIILKWDMFLKAFMLRYLSGTAVVFLYAMPYVLFSIDHQLLSPYIYCFC